MSIEVCAFSLKSCLTAQAAGANRIELCGGMYEGGTTPSAGLIALARKNLNIDLYVMIRPRGGDFCYSDEEFELMQFDIDIAKSLRADGVVLGILKPDGNIDIERTRQLVQQAAPMKVTFHRAFDMSIDPQKALEDIITTGVVRLLSSGQAATALQGIGILQQLQAQAKSRIEIMAGAGVSAENAHEFLKRGIKSLHLTGKNTFPSQMIYRKEGLSMASVPQSDEFSLVESDFQKIQDVCKIGLQLRSA